MMSNGRPALDLKLELFGRRSIAWLLQVLLNSWASHRLAGCGGFGGLKVWGACRGKPTEEAWRWGPGRPSGAVAWAGPAWQAIYEPG